MALVISLDMDIDDFTIEEINFLRWLFDQNASQVLDVHIDEFLTDHQRSLFSSIQEKLKRLSSY